MLACPGRRLAAGWNYPRRKARRRCRGSRRWCPPPPRRWTRRRRALRARRALLPRGAYITRVRLPFQEFGRFSFRSANLPKRQLEEKKWCWLDQTSFFWILTKDCHHHRRRARPPNWPLARDAAPPTERRDGPPASTSPGRVQAAREGRYTRRQTKARTGSHTQRKDARARGKAKQRLSNAPPGSISTS